MKRQSDIQFSPFEVRECCGNFLKKKQGFCLFLTSRSRQFVRDIASKLREQAKLRVSESNPNPTEADLLNEMKKKIAQLSEMKLSKIEKTFLEALKDLYKKGMHAQDEINLREANKVEMVPDFYALLGVSNTASEREITLAYYRLARDNHPDRNPGMEGHMAELSKAKEVLTKDRDQYDCALQAYQKHHVLLAEKEEELCRNNRP